MGTGNQVIAPEQAVVQLGGKVHVAAETGSVPRVGNSQSSALFPQHGVTPDNGGGKSLDDFFPGGGVADKFLVKAVDFCLYLPLLFRNVLLERREVFLQPADLSLQLLDPGNFLEDLLLNLGLLFPGPR